MNKDDIDRLNVFPPEGGGENENDETDENELGKREKCIPILDTSSPGGSHNEVGGSNQRDNLPETNDSPKGESPICTLGEVVQVGNGENSEKAQKAEKTEHAQNAENAENTASITNPDDTMNRDQAKEGTPHPTERKESAPLTCSINTVATTDSGENDTTESPPTDTPNCSNSISCISTVRNHNTHAQVELVEHKLECIPVIGEAKEANFAPQINLESKREKSNLVEAANPCAIVTYSEELLAAEDCTREVADVVREVAGCMIADIANEVAKNSVKRGEQILSLARTVSSFQAELVEKNKGTFEEVKKRSCLFVLAIQKSFMNKTEKILCTKCSPRLACLNACHELFKVILKLQVEKETSELYLCHFLDKLKRDVEKANDTAQQRWAHEMTEQMTQRLTQPLTEQVAKEVAHQMKEAQLKINSLTKDKTTLMETIKKWEVHFHQMKSEQEIIHARVKISVHTSFLNFTEYIFHLLLKVHSALCQKSDKLAFLINRLKGVGLDCGTSQGGKAKRKRRGREARGETHHSDGKIRTDKKKERQRRKKRTVGRSKTGNRSEGSNGNRRSSRSEDCTSSLGGSSPPRIDSSSFSKSGNHHSCSTSSCVSNSSMCLSNELCLSDLTHMNTKGLTDKRGKKKGRRKVKQLLIRASPSKEGKNRARSVDNAGKAPPNKGKRKPGHKELRDRRERHHHHDKRKLYSRYRKYKRLYAEELQKNKTLHFLLTNKDEEIAQVRSALKEEMHSRLLLHEKEEKNKLKEINDLKGLLQDGEIINRKLAIRNEEVEELNKNLKKKLDMYEDTQEQLNKKMCELNMVLSKERRKIKRLVSQNGKMKSALFGYNHAVNFLERGRYRPNGKWCVNVSPAECIDGDMGSEADSSVGSKEDSNVGSELYSESSEHLYEDEMYAPLGTVKKVQDNSTKKQRRELLLQGKIKKAHGYPHNNRGKDAYGRQYEQNEYKHVKLNSCCFSDNSVDVRMPRSRRVRRGGGTKGKLGVLKKGNGEEVEHQKGKHQKGIHHEGWQNGQHNTQHNTQNRDHQCAPPNRDERVPIDDQIRRDLQNFDETKYKRIISDITKEEKVIEKMKEDDLYSIFMQNWEESQSHMGSDEGTRNGPLSWSGSFMHHLNRSVLCANQEERIPSGGNYEQVERGITKGTKRGDFTEGSYTNAVDNLPDGHTDGAYLCREENTMGTVTQGGGTPMGHPSRNENVTLNYDPNGADKMHVFPVEETQIANRTDLLRGEEQPHEGEANNRMDTSKEMNDYVGKDIGGVIGGAYTCDVRDGDPDMGQHGTNDIQGKESNQPTNNPQGEAIDEGILKNYETYKKNKDKFIHLTLRRKVAHVGEEDTPTGGGKKNTSLAKVLNKEMPRRESKNCSPLYAEEEEAFQMDKNYSPFQSAQNGNPLDKDRDMRENLMMHYTYRKDNHRGVTLDSNIHDRSHIAPTAYDNTDAHFFQTSERRDEKRVEIRKGSLVHDLGEQNDERGAQKANGEAKRMTPLGIARNPHTNEFSLHNVNNSMLTKNGASPTGHTSGTSYPPLGGGNSPEKKILPMCEDITALHKEGLIGDSRRGDGAAYSSHSLSMLMGANRKDKIGCRLITPDAPNAGATLYAGTHLVKGDMNAEKLCPPLSHEEHNTPRICAAKLSERNGSATPTGTPPIEDHSRGAANGIVNHTHQKGGNPWESKNSVGSTHPKNEALNKPLNEALGPYQKGGAAVPKTDSCEGASQRKSVGDRGVLSRLLRRK
ncbi:hypothetical protein C922_01580 [Plasmodium inui San Antonio 1]|uniref:Uncharacterized protein n=1 Tax=Plasmodium inui San Antonio 1 TaxID=1237626 RepID=W7A9K4_9APIC|nr:hypothetical protein C922_01580 [Plasmodium inui San Antonio 1]EUD67968.1 hypothetical protein C922_01580 [Plasmodium inui San Antonio 1]